MSDVNHSIVIDNVSLVRGKKKVISDLSVSFQAGQTVAIIGCSGSGKTSLLACVATALPINAGDICIEGTSIQKDIRSARRSIGYVPAILHRCPHVRSDEFLELFAFEAGLSGKPMRTAVKKSLEMAGITDPGTPVDSLPNGKAQRLMIARSLLHEPNILIFDDPFHSLDPIEQQKTEELITDLSLSGRTIIAAINNGIVPSCFSHLGLLEKGSLTTLRPAVFAAFQKNLNRTWSYRVVCPSTAGKAMAALRNFGIHVIHVDDDTLDCLFDPAVVPCDELLSLLVKAGITVASATVHPSWTVQLLNNTSEAEC